MIGVTEGGKEACTPPWSLIPLPSESTRPPTSALYQPLSTRPPNRGPRPFGGSIGCGSADVLYLRVPHPSLSND